MAVRTTELVQRLSQRAADLERNRDLCDRLRSQIETFEGTGLGVIVATERQLLDELQGKLQDARDALAALGHAQDTEATARSIAKLDELLADVAWDDGEDVLSDLADKRQRQDARVGDYRSQLDTWKNQVLALTKTVEDARRVRAGVVVEKAALIRLQDRVQQAQRDLDAKNFKQITESLGQLNVEGQTVQGHLDRARAEATATQPYARQADLLFLQAPPPDTVNNRYAYTLLLRTPSELGAHGINIQDTSTLGKQDHDEIRGIISRITAAIEKGAVRGGPATGAVAPQTESASITPVSGVSAPGVASLDELQRRRTRQYIYGATATEDLKQVNYSELLQQIGDLMYRLFMPEQMRRYIADNPCSLTITTNDLELPWELMCYERGRFLCLDRPVARMPMGRAFPPTKQRPPRSGKVRFLLINADPEGTLPEAEREVNTIKTKLTEGEAKDLVEVEILPKEEATGWKLNDILLNGGYDVIHYAGHAYFDPNDADLSGLWLQKEPRVVFYAQKFERLLEGHPLVFLNACQSARTNNEPAPDGSFHLQKPAAGLASSIIYGGARGCIGALWPIFDDPAALFAVDFYNEVLKGTMIGEAMRRARRKSREQYPDNMTWAAFVLYGDPTSSLVE